MPVQKTLSELVSINSVFPSEHKVGEHLLRKLRQLGFKAKKDMIGPNRFNILAQRGKGKSILFYGHMDTVPIYGQWKTNPLKLTQSSGRLYGLGASDMKGGIAALLEAVSNPCQGKIKILLCSDEENISAGAWNAVRKNRRWFGDVKLMVSCEPGLSKKHSGGSKVVTVGRRGRVVISIDITGRSSHGATPEEGINAVEQAAAIATNLRRFALRTHKSLGSEDVFTRGIQGASTSLSIPDKAHIDIDIHTVPPCTSRQALARINDYISQLRIAGAIKGGTRIVTGIKKRATPYIEPYENDLQDRVTKAALSMLRKRFGSITLNYGSSVADDNILFNEIHRPILTIGPAGGNEHSSNEWISSKSLEEIIAVYRTLIEYYGQF